MQSRLPWFETFGEERHRLLVAIAGGALVGYASSSPFRPGPAFDAKREASIYLDPRHRDRGTGTALCTALLEHLTQQPVHLVVAGIALPNEASLALHRRISFAEVGTFRKCARKHGEWTSSTWFERPL